MCIAPQDSRDYFPMSLKSLVMVLLVVVGATAMGVEYQPPYAASFHPLEEQLPGSTNPLTADKPAMLDMNTSLFTPVEEIDFEKRQVTFAREDKLGFRVWEYHFPEMSEYLSRRLRYSFFDGWQRRVVSNQQAEEKKKGLPSLEF